ncbi:MAG: hypothetical protein CSA55_05195 [Ilumatobacter coccineus]|uniref:LppX_LprAFG lipoprotein n=1 Tax=Ilumatobacter coccineus TaxID=467094 RepID=A0A2G6K7G2_9ACTN|nr:MAG: hypothetical protein CSA55_05195 [Ilumatobacter coccineus]
MTMASRPALAVHVVAVAVLVACGALIGFGWSARTPSAHPDKVVLDAPTVVAKAADAMAEVTSVEFLIECEGAPIFLDPYERLALNRMKGQFSMPERAHARVITTINGLLTTELGMIAIGDSVWLSNPITGTFEALPADFGIDLSRVFDPTGGWKPLLDHLGDVTLVGQEDRNGLQYHLTGTAPAGRVTELTVGLVRDQDVSVDLWIDPTSFVVTALEFTTSFEGQDTDWLMELSRFDEYFDIKPPKDHR